MSHARVELKAKNQPIRLPGLKPGVCSGLILSGALYPDLKIGVLRRRTYQKIQNIRLGQGNMESGGLDDETD